MTVDSHHGIRDATHNPSDAPNPQLDRALIGTQPLEGNTDDDFNRHSGTDDDVSIIAYEIWEAEGRPDGRDQEHWFLAKKRVADGDDEGDASGVKDDPNGSAKARPVQPGFDDAAGDDRKMNPSGVRPGRESHPRPAGWTEEDGPSAVDSVENR